MSEQEKMDALLRQSLAQSPPPRLSTSFDPRLARRLRPRRLTRAGRFAMVLYAVLGAFVSTALMRSAQFGWVPIVMATALPLVLGAVVALVFARPSRSSAG